MRPVKWKCTISSSADICVHRLARRWELEGNDAAARPEHEHPLSMSHLLTAPHPLRASFPLSQVGFQDFNVW